MKRYFLVLLWLFGISCIHAQPPLEVKKHALIIAIGNYPIAGGWGQISSAGDVPYLKKAFIKQGFDESNISILVDSQATRKGIENALEILRNKIAKGDVVVIHFSSHGEQIEDDNGDEPDGLDESIVTFNAIAPGKSQNFAADSAGYFRDDRFGNYVNAIRSKLGSTGDLVVFMDACHSGSGTRGAMKTRGGQKPFVSPNFKNDGNKNGEDNDVFKENEATNNNSLSSYVVISAARSEQLAYEVLNEDKQSMGSLSYSICKVFENMETDLTYRGLFAKIQSVLNAKVQGQNPVMEGTGVDRKLFGGNFVKQNNFIEIDKIKGPKQLELKSGLFAGLNIGAQVLLFPSNTQDPLKAVCLDTGIVISATTYKSIIKTQKEFKLNPSDVWVFVDQPVYNLDSLVLSISSKTKSQKSSGYTAEDIEKIKLELKDRQMIKFAGDPELKLSRGLKYDSLIVFNNGYFFDTIERNADYYVKLKAKLDRYIQYQFLQGVKLTDSNAMVQVELVPIVGENPDTSLIQSKIKLGVCQIEEGDELTIRVTNPGNEDVYINILELQPDGIVNALLPNRTQNIYPKDLIIPAHSSRLFSEFVIGIGPPFGFNTYKIFVSKKAIDLENLATARALGQSRGGNFEVLEKIVDRSYETSRGSNVSVKTGNANGSVTDLIFEIIPAKE